jgi:hypothetical protein
LVQARSFAKAAKFEPVPFCAVSGLGGKRKWFQVTLGDS